jgi:hypothetical protein
MKKFSPKRNVPILCKSKVASNEATKFDKRKMRYCKPEAGAEPGFRYRRGGRTLSVDKNYIVPTRDFDVGLKNYGI